MNPDKLRQARLNLPVTARRSLCGQLAYLRIYRDAVKSMQLEGIMMGGREGNKFNPKASAPRRGWTNMLNRYVKMTIDCKG